MAIFILPHFRIRKRGLMLKVNAFNIFRPYHILW